MTASYNIIPKPLKLKKSEGYFRITPHSKILIKNGNDKIDITVRIFIENINLYTGYTFKVEHLNNEKNIENCLLISLLPGKDNCSGEGYELSIKENEIRLTANKEAGIFYGLQTLKQLIYQYSGDNRGKPFEGIRIPCCHLFDNPRFAWRGLMLDSARTFLTKEFIKRYIDLLAFYKMNILHWHLTDDQGWRIEIKKYPKLAQIGSWRIEEDGSRSGGFYSHEDIKEIVEYAADRNVTIIPEIEMPGHSSAALSSYPEYSCEKKQNPVGTLWGIYKEIFCAGNEKAFDFIKDILDEVVELFPGNHVHIGGDEVPKDKWYECKLCKKRLKDENFNDIKNLHKYFLERIKIFLNDKNKKTIVWDDFEEYGIIDGVITQSWRGMKPAVQAAKSSNYSIVSPTDYSYLDYDVSIIDLNKVYEFGPVPDELSNEESKFILGGECNMWTERVSQDQIDCKVFPRLFAMAEVLWSDKTDKDFFSFYERVKSHYKILDNLKIGYGTESKSVLIKPHFDQKGNKFNIIIECKYDFLNAFYTLDGSNPTTKSEKYIGPFNIDYPCQIKASAFLDGSKYGEDDSRLLPFHKGLGATIKFLNNFSEEYPGTGEKNLIDGITGSKKFNDGYWQGYEEKDLFVIIDLCKIECINNISINFLQDLHSLIFLPNEIQIDYSVNGTVFYKANIQQHILSLKKQHPFIYKFSAKLFNINARYLKVFARNIKLCPEWHPDAGKKAWLFADEIIIE